MITHDEIFPIVQKIQNNIDYEKNYVILLDKLYRIKKWFMRKYSSIIFQYDLLFDDLEQEINFGIISAVKNCPTDCRNCIEYFMRYIRGACLNYFKYNTNRIAPHSENKEKRLEEYKTFSSDEEVNEDGDTYLSLRGEEDYHYENILDKMYYEYAYKKINDFCNSLFIGYNENIFKDFFYLTIDELENKYTYSYKNICQYVHFIIATLKTSNNFRLFCDKYLTDLIIERPFQKLKYENHFQKVNLLPLLNAEIITDYTGKKCTSFTYGIDCTFSSYFRNDFPKNLLTIDK